MRAKARLASLSAQMAAILLLLSALGAGQAGVGGGGGGGGGEGEGDHRGESGAEEDEEEEEEGVKRVEEEEEEEGLLGDFWSDINATNGSSNFTELCHGVFVLNATAPAASSQLTISTGPFANHSSEF